MPLCCRSRSFQASYFYHISAFRETVLNVMADFFSDFVVVCAYKSGIFFGVYLTVNQYDRNTMVISLFYYRGNGFSFIRRNDKQVYTLIDKRLDIFNLFLVLVIGTRDVNLHIRIEQSFSENFIIHLCAPFIVAAL